MSQSTMIDLGKSSKHELNFQTHKLWNYRLGFNQEIKFSTNLMLNDEIRKNIINLIIYQSKENSNKQNEYQIWN